MIKLVEAEIDLEGWFFTIRKYTNDSTSNNQLKKELREIFRELLSGHKDIDLADITIKEPE